MVNWKLFLAYSKSCTAICLCVEWLWNEALSYAMQMNYLHKIQLIFIFSRCYTSSNVLCHYCFNIFILHRHLFSSISDSFGVQLRSVLFYYLFRCTLSFAYRCVLEWRQEICFQQNDTLTAADDEQHTTHFAWIECWWWNGKSVKPFGIYSFMHCKMWIASLFSLQHTPFRISLRIFDCLHTLCVCVCVKHSRMKWEIIKSTHSLLICTGLGATNEAKMRNNKVLSEQDGWAHLDDFHHFSAPKSRNISFYYCKWMWIQHFCTFKCEWDGSFAFILIKFLRLKCRFSEAINNDKQSCYLLTTVLIIRRCENKNYNQHKLKCIFLDETQKLPSASIHTKKKIHFTLDPLNKIFYRSESMKKSS